MGEGVDEPPERRVRSEELLGAHDHRCVRCLCSKSSLNFLETGFSLRPGAAAW